MLNKPLRLNHAPEEHAEEPRNAMKRKLSFLDAPDDRFRPLVKRWASGLHLKMQRLYWEERDDNVCDPTVISHLRKLLFMERRPHPGAEMLSASASQLGQGMVVLETSTAFASQEETRRVIVSVLQCRQRFLRSKGILDMFHVLTDDERSEMIAAARKMFEGSPEQLLLQARDFVTGLAKGMARAGCAGDAPQPTGKGILHPFLREQKHKRWCRHLEHVCGTKQVWEVLAYTGRFDADLLLDTLPSGEPEEEGEYPCLGKDEKHGRRELLDAKAEGTACYNEDRRLARQREMLCVCGATQPSCSGAVELTPRHLLVLLPWDSKMLQEHVNKATVDTDGSKSDGLRRIMDGCGTIV